ncbi:MAG TPA: hypothetical protein DDY92_06695 [Dialister sp.]|nr:hypothetical protein [Dialister sp.]
MNHMLKKILLCLLLILIGAAGWYFLYWQKTPAYAAGEIQQAVQRKDWDLFQKRVDLNKVYGYALDDILAELQIDGKPQDRLAASLLKSIKKEVVKELIRQTEIKFQEKAPVSKSMLDKPIQTLTAYVGSSALSLTDIFQVEEKDGLAIAHVKLHDKDLNKDFTWDVQLEKDVNGNWTATRILNLRKYLEERKNALS